MFGRNWKITEGFLKLVSVRATGGGGQPPRGSPVILAPLSSNLRVASAHTESGRGHSGGHKWPCGFHLSVLTHPWVRQLPCLEDTEAVHEEAHEKS